MCWSSEDPESSSGPTSPSCPKKGTCPGDIEELIQGHREQRAELARLWSPDVLCTSELPGQGPTAEVPSEREATTDIAACWHHRA